MSDNKKLKTVVILASAESEINARVILENIEGETFGSEAILLENLKCMGIKQATIHSLSEFMDNWNNTDDDDNHINVADYFIGYASLEK